MSFKPSKQNKNYENDNETNYKERREHKTYKKPINPLEHNQELLMLRAARKKMFESTQLSNKLNERDLQMQASQAETAMNEKYAAARWAKLEEEKRKEAAKAQARSYYAQRQIQKKLENRGHLLPLDPKNDINNNQRIQYYSKNHRCVHNKKFDMLHEHNGTYKVRCTHFESKVLRVKNNSERRCFSCGANNFTLYSNKCGCRAYCCNRCFVNNYYYKNIQIPNTDTEISCVHQIYDCHYPGETDVKFTVQDTDSIVLLGGENVLVPGKIIDIFFTDTSIQQTPFKPKIPAENFLNALKTDKYDENGNKLHTSYAEKLMGKLKEDTILVDKFEPPVVESEEQGGTVSTAASAANGAKDSLMNSVRTKLADLMAYLKAIPDRLLAMKATADLVGRAMWFVEMALYYLGIIYDHMDFSVIVHLASMFIHKSWTANSLHLLLLVSHLTSIEQAAIRAVKKLRFSKEEWRKFVSEPLSEEHRKIAGPFCTIMNYFSYKRLWGREDFEFIGEKYTLTNEGIRKIKNQSFLSYFLNTREEGFSFDCFAMMVKDKLGSIFDMKNVKEFSKFLKEMMPLLTAANISMNLCPKICNLVMRWIFGESTNEAWMDEQLYDESSPIHKLLEIYLAYQACTVSGRARTSEDDIAHLRSEFYSTQLAAQEYVAKEKRWCSKFVNFIKGLEHGMSNPPQPADRKYEPTLFVLQGLPGVGKSTIWPHIIGAILGKSAKEIREMTYTWNNTSEYQTGMSNKKIILYDDFGQDRSENKETLSLIHMCTSAPYAINSANIVGPEIKGLFASPDFVVVCTNDADLATDKVFSKNAVLRRVDLGIEVTERIDLSVPEQISAQRIFNIKHCSRNDGLVGKSTNLYELTTLLDMIHTNKRDDYMSIKENMQVRMEKISLDILQNLSPAKQSAHLEFFKNNVALKDDYERYLKLKKKESENIPAPAPNPAPNNNSGGWLGAFRKSPPNPAYSINGVKPTSSGDVSDFTVASMEQAGASLATLKYYCSAAIKIFLLDSVDIVLPAYVVASLAAFMTFAYDYQIGGPTTLKKTIYSGLRVAMYSVMTAFAGFSIYTAIFGRDEEESGTTKTAKASKPPVTVTSKQEGADEFERISALFKRASGTLVSSNGRTINCLAIGGHWLLIPNHFFYDLESNDHWVKEGVEIVLKLSSLPVPIHFDFRRHNVRRIMNETRFFDGREVRTDVVLYLVDQKVMPAMKNIVKHFWNGEYDTTGMDVAKIDYLVQHTYSNASYQFRDNIEFATTHEFEVTHGKVTHDRICTYRDKGKDHYCHIVAEATYKPRVRSCGSVVIRSDGVTRPALGIHVAATMANRALFHFVTAEELNRAMKDNNIDTEESGFVDASAPPRQNDLPDYHQFLYIGTTDKKHTSYQPTKTDLQPSLVYETLGPHKTEPSLLSHKDPRIPEEKRKDFWPTMMDGYKNVSTFTWEDIQEATMSVIEDNRKAYKEYNIKPRILNDDEVLNGTPEWPSIGRIPMDSSCGWPYNCQSLKKKDLIEDDGVTLSFKPQLRQDYEHALGLLNAGVKPFLPFTTTVKDERLPLAKIYDTPKSRLFMAGNVVHYLICRKYFAHALELAYVNKRGYVSYMDRISLDWHDFIMQLTEVGEEGQDGDFKHYDRMITRILLYAKFLINIDGLVQVGLIKVESLLYKALQELICCPNIIFGNQVYLALGILCSGGLLTYKGNCDINEVMNRSAYLAIMRQYDPRLGTIQQYKNKVRGKRGGDDTIDVIAASIIDIFNGVTLAMWFQKYNVTYTTADKKGDRVAKKHFKELSFLKNTTGVMHGYYVPLGDMDSLIESCYWVRLNKNNKDIVKATEDNVNASLRAIYFYGKEEFNRIRTTFLNKEPRLSLLTYSELNVIWDKYGYFPGSHSDYATKNDQELLLTTDPVDKFEQYGLRVDDKIAKMLNVQSLEESGLVGKDTASQSITQNHPQVGIDETIITEPEVDTPQDSLNMNQGSQSNVNGAFIESKEQAIKKSVHVGRLPITSADFRAQGHINDKNWTLSKLASKFTSLGQVSWDISQKPGTVLKFWNLPNDILITPALRTPFDVTAYERFKSIRFKVTTSASPFYSGRLIMGFDPFFDTIKEPLSGQHLRLTQLGGIVINPVENQTYEMTIPYRHYLDWLEYPQDCLGQFYIVVQNQLRTGADNVNSIAVSVFVSIEGAEFKVPEYVTAQTKSMKVVASRPQGDDGDDTAITIQKHVSSINENFQDNYTMMCAGTGTYQEPVIKQFPDHPHDIVQLLKRDRPYTFISETVDAFSSTDHLPGTKQIVLDVNQIYNFVTGRYGVIYELYRGSLVFRGDFYGTQKDNGPKKWCGKAYFVNDVHTNPPENLQRLGIDYDINIGYHKFDEQNPPSFSIPFWSPNFVARGRGENVPFQTPLGAVILEFYNYDIIPVTINGILEVRVDDDFAMGCFTGMPGLREYKPNINKKITQADSWYMPRIFSQAQGGETKQRVDNLLGTARNNAKMFGSTEAVKMIDKAQNFVDIAAENMEPVMEIADMIGSLLDAPPITYQPTPVMPRKWNYGVANNIMQYVEKLGNTNHNGASYSDSSAFGTNVLETNMYHLIQNIKTLENTFVWSTDDQSGKILASWKVGPTRSGNSSIVASPLDYFARDFNYWAGSLIYGIDIVASQMHTGRLVLTFHPNLVSTDGLTIDMATQQYFVSFDLDKGKGCSIVAAPYLYKMPFRTVPSFEKTPQTLYPQDAATNGIMVLWVMNPLRASPTVSKTVDINLYKMGGKDFRLASYGSTVNANIV